MRKYVGLGVVVIVIVALLYYAPTIISYIQNPTNSSNGSSTTSYTNLTLRALPASEVDAKTIEFGDTDYTFTYSTFLGYHLYMDLPFQSKDYTITQGETYKDCGVEIKVSKIDSDYISGYVVILVKPTVQNYMFSQFHYTKVNITLGWTQAVNISSGLINKTNQYWFSYTHIIHPSFYEPQLTIRTTSQSNNYVVFYDETIRDFDIETSVYKIDSYYMVIYVKPLY
jgi:hypothetical protein